MIDKLEVFFSSWENTIELISKNKLLKEDYFSILNEFDGEYNDIRFIYGEIDDFKYELIRGKLKVALKIAVEKNIERDVEKSIQVDKLFKYFRKGKGIK